MNFDADFFQQAQTVLVSVVKDWQPRLVEASGQAAHELKADKSVVTEFDLQMEVELKRALVKLDSSIGFEGEEHGVEGNRETFWLIDPIDATEAFIRGMPVFRNMVTLIDGGEPVFTFVFKPVSDQLFIASKGKGSYMNGMAIHVSNRPLDRAWIELDSPVQFRSPQASLLASVENSIKAFRRFDDFTLAATGQVDGHIVYKATGGPWDYASRALLIQEAGGRVCNLGSDRYDYKNNDLLAANPLIFDNLQNSINEALSTA